MSHAAGFAEVDSVHMRRALVLALNGWGQTAPNPMVGAVVVAGNDAVGEGWHPRYGEAHAEVKAIEAAGERAHGATMYVTLEPCAHFGKTPPCVDKIIDAGVARVVVAVGDPSAVARGGIEKLRAAGLEVDVGVERAAALELNAPFFNGHCRDRPWVTLKLAISADGGLADPSGAPRWITGPESRRHVHHLRANVDAIVVGVGTVLADDPSLTVRDGDPPRIAPLRVVFDSTLRTPPEMDVVRTARQRPTTIYAATSTPPSDRMAAVLDLGVDITLVDGSLARLRSLFTRGVRSVLVEGGARLAGSLISESLVDRLVIFRSSLVLGAEAVQAFAYAPPEFESSLAERPVVEERRFGGDVMTTYALEDVPCSPD